MPSWTCFSFSSLLSFARFVGQMMASASLSLHSRCGEFDAQPTLISYRSRSLITPAKLSGWAKSVAYYAFLMTASKENSHEPPWTPLNTGKHVSWILVFEALQVPTKLHHIHWGLHGLNQPSYPPPENRNQGRHHELLPNTGKHIKLNLGVWSLGNPCWAAPHTLGFPWAY